MPNQFGGPTGRTSFLAGLIGGTAGHFKSEHDRQQDEDLKRKQMDYQILMSALETMKPNLTPSQAGEILTRATDIFKPKGHTDIKDRLKEVFGMNAPYQMQGGSILQGGMSKPRAQVGTENAPTGETTGTTFPMSGVTLPPPPGPERPVYEQTYREQELQDKERLIGAQLDKQLAAQTHADQLKRAQREEQNREVRSRNKEALGMKSDAEFDTAVKRKLTSMGFFEDTPENRELAAAALQQEAQDKHAYAQSRININAERLKQIDAGIKDAHERINIAKQRLGKTGAANFDKHPQVKGAWQKVAAERNAWQSALTHAAEAYAQGDVDGGKYYDGIAERAQATMQETINAIEQKIADLQAQAGGVTLPNPPNTGARPSYNLRQWKADHPGASAAEIEAKRQKFKGYNIIE